MENWKRQFEQAPININEAVVERVESFKFLGVHINKLTWPKHTKTVVKRARQNLFHLRRLKRFGMGPQILKRFYSGTIESILTGLPHCLLWQILGLQPQDTTEGSAYGPVHHWGQTSCHPGPLYQAVSEEGPKICQRPQPPRSLLPHG